jgi:sensor histidine kinase YesM
VKTNKILTNKFDIEFFEKNTTVKLILVSLVIGIFIIYLNFAFVTHELAFLGKSKYVHIALFFIFRYFYFSTLIWFMLRHNLLKVKLESVGKRFFQTVLIGVAAYFIYIGLSLLLNPKKEWFSGFVLFQFFVMIILCTLIGHVAHLYNEHRKKEKEIEQLKTENLQSRYVALTNQINPHFFFNSLNGLSSLIRKKNEDNAIEYINKLSDVFRYVLQSDKKSIVSLGEELECVAALFYMMEVRFANKLVFHIQVKEESKNLKIPVLSLLPLIDNVVVHNVIDSEHKMDVIISLNDEMELLVSNPIYPKLNSPNTNGTGLKNLENRFMLLMDRKIKIIDDGKTFTVCLPLIKDKNEDTNR